METEYGVKLSRSLRAVSEQATLNIHAHLARCEANYSRLLQLLKDSSADLLRSRTIEFAGLAPPMRFDHIRVSAYTSKVIVRQDIEDGIPSLYLKLQVYHDTRAAEVVGYQGHHDFRVVDEKPRFPMTQRFEKMAMADFLTELLEHCLAFGLSGREELLATDEPTP